MKYEMIRVKCPNCGTPFIRSENELAAGENCGVCLTQVVMVAAPFKKEDRKALLGSMKKHRVAKKRGIKNKRK